MIIKKRDYNLFSKNRGTWPFSVSDVTVIAFTRGKETAFAIAHNFGLFALSGALESMGFAKLETSGIWKLASKTRNSKIIEDVQGESLTNFFRYITDKYNAAVDTTKEKE